MKKIKFLIASMIGAIALVFACVFGLGVNAENHDITSATTLTPKVGDTYKLLASNVDKNNIEVAGTTYGIYTLKSASNASSNKWSAVDTNYFDTTKWMKGLRTGGSGCTIDVNVGANNKAKITTNIYMHDTVGTGKGIVVDTVQHDIVTKDTSQSHTDTIKAGSNGIITITFTNKVGFTELYTEIVNDAPVSDE